MDCIRVYSSVAMATTAPPSFFLLCWVLRTASSAFPEEPGPLNFIPTEVVRRYPVFLGRPHQTWLRQEPLHIQRVLQVNRTLYIGARDDLYRVELDAIAGDEMFYSKCQTETQWRIEGQRQKAMLRGEERTGQERRGQERTGEDRRGEAGSLLASPEDGCGAD
ncbi:Semaphorin-6B Semaphorin-Z [Channa argus]|uniref:Semaphorin-6B Semaphorin-Z n=1 Tax=Channa argus TaxID=215402 RepID=A0A6G1PLF6_CHAAH|nr:Semaphorin-6B Semaphorin-Z [Channa argus]